MADTTVKLGRLPIITLGGPFKEQLGDGLDAVGPVLTAAEAKPRAAELSIPVRGPDHRRSWQNDGQRLRRQVRALLENPIVRSHGLFLSVSFDPELDGWLLVGGGELGDEKGMGPAFADWDLMLSDTYRVGSSRTVRPARRAEVYDRRVGSTPRDWLRRVYSTGFSAMGMLPLVWLPPGVSDVTSAGGAIPLLGQATGREGTVKVAAGLVHSDVASFELADPSAGGGDVVAVDRRSQTALVAFGHSYAAGYGLTPTSARWPEQYARGGHRGRIGADLCNSGAVISWNSGAQGWSYFLQSQARYADPAAGELVQSFACVEIGMGINDLAQHPDSDVGHAPILEAFRRVIVRARSAAVIEDNDSSASYTGSWSALASTDKNSGAGWRQSTGAGEATLTVPATYAGTDIWCCWVANKDSSGSYEVRVDGTLVWSGTIGGAGQGPIMPAVLGTAWGGIARNLGRYAAGTHTVKVKCLSVTGPSATWPGFDCLEVMCVAPTPVAVQNVARPANYSLYAAQAYPPTDTVVQNFNARQKTSIEGEWDAYVGIVDIDTALAKKPALFQGDGLHPTEQGHALIARAHAAGRPVPVEEIPGPDYPLAQPSFDCPSLDNGRCVVSYAGAGVWRITGWDPTVNPAGGGWVQQAAFMVRRIGDATGLCTTAVSFAVAEASTERVVVEAVMRNNSDGYSRERVYITLQRGWTAPRVEVYPAPEASGAQADASILVYSDLVDAATTVSKQDSGGVATAATAGTGGQSLTHLATLGAATFTGENWVWMARHGRTFAIAAAVLQTGLGATCLYDGSAGFGGSRNGFMVSSGSGGAGYCGVHLGLSRQAPAPAIEAEAMTLDGTSTSQADGAASGGTCVKGTRTAVGQMATQASVVLPATYRVLIRARVDSGATGSFNVVHGFGASTVVTTTSTSWVWLDSGELAGFGTQTLVLNAWRSAGGSGNVYVDRVELVPTTDRGNANQPTGRYDGARDHGQAALADTFGVPGLVARGT